MIFTATGTIHPSKPHLLFKGAPVASAHTPVAGMPREGALSQTHLLWWMPWLFAFFLLATTTHGWAAADNASTILEQFGQAARQGDSVAQTNLGTIYLNGVGVRRDYAKAFYWFQQAAQQGEGLAQFNLGVLYQEGKGTAKDATQALHWFQQVERQSNRGEQFNPLIKGWAQLKLGFAYYEGRGVPQNHKKAFTWFLKAAERGLLMAQEMLGRMYAEGLGIPQSAQHAFLWYEKAAQQGSKTAQTALKKLSGRWTPAQRTQARTVPPQPSPADIDPPSESAPAPSRADAGQTRFPLTVLPVPADARVRILNIRPKYTPGMRLPPGRYHLEISREGYQPEKRWVTVQAEGREVDVALVPNTPIARPETAAIQAQESATDTRTTATAPQQPSGATLPWQRPAAPPATQARESATDTHTTAVAQQPSGETLPWQRPAAPQETPTKTSANDRLSASLAQQSSDAQRPPAVPQETPTKTSANDRLSASLAQQSSGAQRPPAVPQETTTTPTTDTRPPQQTILPGRFPLTVFAIPADARVRILNIRPTYTPGMRLEPGRYHLEISREGYQPEKRWVTLRDGLLEVDVTLAPREPEGTSRQVGLDVDTPPTGASTAQAVRPQQAKQAADPTMTRRMASPTPDGTRHALTIHTEPPEARVQVMNITQRYQPGMQLKPGPYRIRVSHPGFQTQQLQVMLGQEDREVEVILPQETRTQTPSAASTTQAARPVQQAKQAADPTMTRRMASPTPDGTRHALTIHTEPPEARVQVMNITQRYQPGMQLKPGPYRIRVSHPGFQTQQLQVMLGQEDREVEVILPQGTRTQPPSAASRDARTRKRCRVADTYTLPDPRRHLLTVQNTPKDARIRILNIKPPYRQGIALVPGFYHMSVAKEAYETAQCWAEIMDEDLILDIPLTPLPPGALFPLTIQPHPSDARVRLLNVQTPYRPGVRLMPGVYHIEVSRKAYETKRLSVTLTQEAMAVPVVLKELKLDARPTLTVVPVLKQARIRIVNANVPYRPGTPLTPGKYLIEVTRQGFKTQQRWVEVTEQDLRIEIEMEEETAPNRQNTLTIRATPPGAQIRILNLKTRYEAQLRVVGASASAPSMPLAPGAYMVEVSKGGFKPQQRRVTLAGEDITLEIALKKTP